MFTLGPINITKELLLNRHRQEEYMTHYLGINPRSGLFNSPLRKDANPTCSFYINKKGDLIFKDFGTGFHGNFITVVMEKFGVPYSKALSIIAHDFGIVDKPGYTINKAEIEYDGTIIEEKEPTVIQCEIKDFTEEEYAWWASFGITPATLKKFKVFSVKNVFLNGHWFCDSSSRNPIYGYFFGKKDGIEQWKVYFPKKLNHRFLLNTSVLQGANQLQKTGDYVVVTKSMKDVMTLYEMGIPAVAPQAESVVLNDSQVKILQKRFKVIITNGDWDRAGQMFMIKSRKKYPTICLSFKNKDHFGKDISDFVAKFGIEKACNLQDKILSLIKKQVLDYQFKYYKS